MPPRSLPILRPLVLAVALPLTAMACLAGLGSRSATAPARGRVYVTNEGSGELTVIDTGTDAVIATVRVGKRPRGVRVDARGERILVALSGSPAARPGPPVAAVPGVAPAALQAPDRGADGIAIVDAATRSIAAILPSGQDPESFDLLPDGKSVVASNEETSSASVIDIAAARLVRSVGVGDEPEGVAAAPDGAAVAVTSERGARVDFVDPHAGRVIASVPTCLRPRGVVFTRDGALAFVTCEESAAVAVLDARGHRALAEIPLPEGSRPMGLALSPDGRRLFVSNGRAGTVSAIDVASRRVAATGAGVGARCWGIAVTPDGRKLYVANGPSDDVAVLDASTLAVLKRIPTGRLPWGVAMSP
jgi:YVTN family beta-propeller protein